MTEPPAAYCPHCQGTIENKPIYAGRAIRCPYCQGHLTMPAILVEQIIETPVTTPVADTSRQTAIGNQYQKQEQSIPAWVWVVCVVGVLSVLSVFGSILVGVPDQEEPEARTAQDSRDEREQAEQERIEQFPNEEEKDQPPPVSKAKLHLPKWTWRHEHGFAIVEGEVENISSSSINNLMAVVTFRTESGDFITSDEALTTYNPILPGQKSPWTVMATWNPQMSAASVQFKTLSGGTILTERD